MAEMTKTHSELPPPKELGSVMALRSKQKV